MTDFQIVFVGLLLAAFLAIFSGSYLRLEKIFHDLLERLLLWFFIAYARLTVLLFRMGAPRWLVNLLQNITPRFLRQAAARVYDKKRRLEPAIIVTVTKNDKGGL